MITSTDQARRNGEDHDGPCPVVDPTVITALLGGGVGALALGLGTGHLVASLAHEVFGGLYAVAGAVLAASAGTFLGAAAALLIAFRDEAARPRVVTAVTTVLLGPFLALTLAVGAAQVASSLVRPPVLPLTVALVLSAVVGRRLALRRR